MLLMSDCGGGNLITNVTLTLDDAAAALLPDSGQIISGTNKPTNYLIGDSFPSPAPPLPYDSTLAAFNGLNPNGAWSLFVADDAALDVGSIARGWYLNITTSGTVPAAADLSVTVTDVPDPAIVGSNVVYTLLVTNHGPWTATGISLNNTLPPNAVYVATSTATGTITTNGVVGLVWTIGTLAKDAVASATITVRPTLAGTISSTNTVFLAESDPNGSNNIAIVDTIIANPTADLVMAVVDAPDPVFIGGNLTYSLYVTNSGPATATGVTVTNTLPPGVSFVSATPSGYTQSGSVIAFTNLGNFGAGLVAVATITVHPNAPATLTNTATCASGVTDPLKGNNTASVKTIVEAAQLSTVVSGQNLVISWSADATGYNLESATSLNPPVTWSPVTNPAPTIANGQKVVTIPIGAGNNYFRLRATVP
jgi:uncharacterized repeat protein (TIGR01451 family)